MLSLSTAKKAGTILFSNVITTTGQALLLIGLARWMDKELLGEVFKVFLIYKTAILLGNLGFNDNPYYFIPKLQTRQYGKFFLQSVWILLLAGLATGVLAALAFQFYVGRLWISLIFIPIITIELASSMTPDFLIAVGRVRESSVFNVFFSVLYVVMALAACLTGNDPIARLTYAILLYGVLRAVATALLMYSYRSSSEALPTGMLRQQLDFGIPLGLSTINYRINKQVDNYVVAGFFNSVTFAEYTVGSWEIPMLLKIPYSITTAYLTKYAAWFDQRNLVELHKKWLAVSEKIILILIPVASFFLIFAQEVIHGLFGSRYQEAVVVFQIFTLTLFTRVSSYTGLLKSMGDTKYVMQNSFQLLALNLVFTLAGVQLLGLYGAPIGTLTANLVTLVFALKRLGKHLNQPISRLLPYAFHLKVSLLSLTLAGALKYAAMFSYTEEWLTLAISVPLYLTLFVVTGSWFQLIGKDDREYILSIFKSRRARHA